MYRIARFMVIHYPAGLKLVQNHKLVMVIENNCQLLLVDGRDRATYLNPVTS